MNRNPGLIVSTSPPVEAPVTNGRLECRTIPLRFLPGRLDIVVSVENHRRSIPYRFTTGNHGGGSPTVPINADRAKQTRCSEQVFHAGGAVVQVSVIKALPRHRRNPN
ncbi:unannotated protein [freshwater metagenome]|uniref:Unannotated protein n=1 Tax=freshwater metagenome TaxID=449393 RepID=A0A6J6DCL8_9ZZZZ